MNKIAATLLIALVYVSTPASGQSIEEAEGLATLFKITEITNPPLDLFQEPVISGKSQPLSEEDVILPIPIKGVARNNMLLVVVTNRLGDQKYVGWVMPTFVKTDKPLPDILSIICDTEVTGGSLLATRGYGESC